MQENEILERLTRVRAAALRLGSASSAKKNAVLEQAAVALLARKDEILAANAEDIARVQKQPPAKVDSLSAFLDRLTLNEARLVQMAESLREVARLADPVGEVAEEKTLTNGLHVRRLRAPLGVIFMIFESRPNVAIEAFSLGFKAGNAMILRGGKESSHTTAVLFSVLEPALGALGLDGAECLWGITDPDRAIPDFLLQQAGRIDIVVPRGGSALIEHVTRNSRIPVIKNDRGMCHVFVQADADLEMARRIVVNAKVQRPGVCNSMETLLVHAKAADTLLPSLHADLAAAVPEGVAWYGCPRTWAILQGYARVETATEASWNTEYLEYKMNCRVVDSLDEALAHIARHGSGHSESIVTASEPDARRFQAGVDAAAAYWNASTRFTDGFELGLGGELGISTQKLHVRGPVGASRTDQLALDHRRKRTGAEMSGRLGKRAVTALGIIGMGKMGEAVAARVARLCPRGRIYDSRHHPHAAECERNHLASRHSLRHG